MHQHPYVSTGCKDTERQVQAQDAHLPSTALDDIHAVHKLTLKLGSLIRAPQGFLQQPRRDPHEVSLQLSWSLRAMRVRSSIALLDAQREDLDIHPSERATNLVIEWSIRQKI